MATRTASTHLSNIYQKLEVRSRGELADLVREKGLLDDWRRGVTLSAMTPASHGAAVAETVNIPVIASGGVGTLDHLVEGVTEGRADAVLAASIFHFGEHTVAEAKQHMTAAGVAVRPA